MKIQHIEIPKISDSRGSLSYLESNDQIPFDIVRIYYLYDLKHGEKRGEHAHYKTEQVMFCLSGSVNIGFDDGHGNPEIIELNTPNIGVLIPPLLWHWMEGLSPDCILLIVASEKYNESDYIRDYSNFQNLSCNL